ncbi:ACS family tartrate transporter-like MFS transporter [Rhodococcus sp. 27YEA15]|uniref:MFS transporter n=1 Tax=Rhodococcus sp. 27YEA15 TaxID=3156259 RepID=UPI003C7D0F68
MKQTSPDTALASAVRKTSRRLIPFLCLIYALNYLDRVNVGFAADGMKSDLGLTAAAFGLGAGLFFIGYCLFEFPSNLMMHKVGARLWIARIMISWGALAAAMSAVQGETSFYVMRILLGISEAGLLPGVILYLTYWFPAEYRGRLTAQFYLALPLSIVIGAPLSSWIISATDGLFGLSGWRFMFFVQGLPAMLIGIAVLFLLPNKPHEAKWLTPGELSALEGALARESDEAQAHGTTQLRKALRDYRIYLMGLILFSTVFGIYAFSFFMPQVVNDFEASFGTELTSVQTGFMTAIPFAVAAVAMWLVGVNSDRTGERVKHSMVALTVGAVGILTALYATSPQLELVGLSIAVASALCALPILWQIPKVFLGGAAAAGGIGLIGAMSNTAGFFAPTVTGALRESSGSFDSSMITIAASMLLGAALLLAVGRTTAFKPRSASSATDPQKALSDATEGRR